MDASSGQNMPFDQLHQGRQGSGTGADPVGERRDIQVDAFAGISFALPVQRQMVGKLSVKHHGQQFGPSPAASDRMEGRRWLGDRLARPAAPLLTDGLDDFPLPRHDLQGLGDALAQLGELTAAAGAGRRARHHHAFPRQVGG